MRVIFDLDKTIIDSTIADQERENRNWNAAYSLIPKMPPYYDVVGLIHELLENGVKVAVVTSSPSSYCERILNYLGIQGVVTVCYHDTEQHKPNPEPILKAIEEMDNSEDFEETVIFGDEDNDMYMEEETIAIGDEEKDIIAANRAGVTSVFGYWGNYYSYLQNRIKADVFCKDEEDLMRYFVFKGVELENVELKKRNDYTYQLFDYYPVTRIHDKLSEEILDEVKGRNDNLIICETFCRTFEQTFNTFDCQNYGIFVVPSSTERKWNSKLTDYVVPRLVNSLGLINCSRHILRHTTHEKQAFGGDRSVASNLATMELQYRLPKGMKGAFIIDDITTTGNVFEACREIIFERGIPMKNIYCAAIGGTI